MGLFDDLYKQPQPSGDFGATTLPAVPTATGTVGAEHPFVSLLKTLLAPTSATARPGTSGADFGSLLSALRTVPHYGIGGNLIPAGTHSSLTPEADWRRMFPNKPTGY